MTKNNIKVNIQEKNITKQSTFVNSLSEFFIVSFFYLISVLAFLDAFKFPDVSFYGVFIGFLLITFLVFVKNKNIKTYGSIGFLLLITLLFIMLNKYTMNGLFLSLNHFADVVGAQTTYLLPQYKILIQPESFKLALNLFMIYLFLLVSYMSYLIVNKNLSSLIWVLIIVILFAQLVTGIHINMYLNIGLFLASLLIINRSFIHKKTFKSQLRKSSNNIALVIGMILTCIFVGTLLIAFAIQPQANYEKSASIDTVKEKTSDKVDDLRYEKNAPDSLTRGDFLKLNELKLTNLEALEVVMEEPTPYYLKGFVGADYSRNKWSELSNEAIYENHGLFYSLNESGFTPLNQLSIVDEITDEGDNQTDSQQMSINNINAHSKYLYTPYEITDTFKEIDELHYFNESHLISKNFKGKRHYSFNVSKDLVTHYPAIANRLYENKNQDGVKSYLNQEAYYNQYVYDYYTELPEEIENLLGVHFGKKHEDETHIAYEQAINQVTEYLNETIDYNENPKKLNKNRDFLSYIIEESREGYAPHYATTGTLLFRYLGIPARYVEGYLVTPDIIKNKEPFDKLTITGKEAHAWTEIYFDQVGWIPIEVTPEYEDVMPETDLTDYPKEKGLEENQLPDESGNENNEEREDISDSNENNTENDHILTEDLEKDQPHFLIYLLMLLLIMIIILLLVYLIYLIKKRLELRKLIKSFTGNDLNKSTTRLTYYILFILHYIGIKERKGSIREYEKDVENIFGPELAKEFKDVLKINERAVYSGKPTSEIDHKFVLEYKDKLLRKIIENKNIFQKIKMRFRDFIY